MFGCCGCPNKKTNKTNSEDEEEEKEKEVETPTKGGSATYTRKSSDTIAVLPNEHMPDKIEESEVIKAIEPDDVLCDSATALPDMSLRKSSLKKPKPRLSISTEVKFIPTQLEGDEGEGDAQSPLSDEVFAGEGSDPPRANLGVNPLGLGLPAVEFPVPRSPGLDVPLSPRGKAPTPHPKRSSMPAVLPRWLSEEEDENGGSLEPPVTPVAKDELALRRHRFFAELLAAAQAATEHRVRFDPLGPEFARDTDSGSKEIEALLERLEKITERLEKAVPILESTLEPLAKSIVVTKSLQDLLDEHLTPTEKEKINGLISDKLISPDSSADVADFSDHEPILDLIDYEVIDGQGSEIDYSVEDITRDVQRFNEAIQSCDIENELDSYVTIEEDNVCEKAEESVEEQVSKVEESWRLGEEAQVVDGEETDSIGEEVEVGESGKVGEESQVVEAEESGREGELSDTEGSSDSPDTVVGEASPRGRSSPEETFTDPNMTNSQSTLSMSVQGFQSIVQGPLASYLQLSSKIGGDVAQHAKMVQNAFQAQLQYLTQASLSRKPSAGEDQLLLQPTSQYIQAVQEFREKHRTSPMFNHLSAISESIPALGWVTVSPAPSPFVKEMNDAGQFYTNRVLKDWKEKDKTHVEWTKAWVSTLSELQVFVKQHHTTGLVWSGTGAARGAAPPPPPSGPMPPPPPPLDLNLGDMDIGASDSNDRNALFAEINKGTDVTKGLKKVTSDMQTHKNPSMRAGPKPFIAPTQPAVNAKTAPSQVDKPPSFNRDGKKWLIEYQKGNHNLVVDGAEMNNVVYAFRCVDSTITVKGKINSIFLDSCKKTAVVFDSVVSSIEFVNCQSVQMQVLGAVPTISIDKTDGCQMYLSDASLSVEIVSSKSSEMNVLVPKGNGDFTEYAIPEQFRTTVKKTGLTTSAVEATG